MDPDSIRSVALFEVTFTSFFKGKKSQRGIKTVEIKIFLTMFLKDSDPNLDPYL